MINLFLTMVPRNFNGDRIVFSTNSATVGPDFTPHTQINLKCIIDLNVRAKTIKNIEKLRIFVTLK